MKKINPFLSLFFMLIIASITTVQAQWTTVSTNGIENICNVSKVFSDGTDLYAYVSGGGVYKSSDGGDSWSAFNFGLPTGIAIVGFTATATKIYVAADKNGIYSSDKATAGFTKLGTVPVLTNSFTSLESIKDTLYLGINGKGVYKCVIPTATYTQLTSGLSGSAAVMALAVDSITGVGKRLYAGVTADNGFYVKNAHNDSWIQVTINNETESANKAQVRCIYAKNGKVLLGGVSQARGLVYVGETTDFNTYNIVKADTSLVASTVNTVALVGQHIYLAATNGVWKSTDISIPTIRYSQLRDGLQTPRANTASVIGLSNGNVWVAQTTGAFVSSNNGVTWSRKLNEKVTLASINGFKEYEGKLYALTSSGVYVSQTGDGGDWVRLGNGLNSNVSGKSLSFGALGTFATSDGALFKLNGTNWETVDINLPGMLWDHPQYSQIVDIEQFNNGTKTCLFGSAWRSAGIYRYDGDQWDLYATSTVNDVTTALTGDADSGLTLSVANDSTQAVIAGKFMYDAVSNTLMCFGKNTIQYSFDFGNSWQWRMQNYNIRLNQGNIRAAEMKNTGSQKFVFIGTDATFGGAWTMGKTEIGTMPENVGGNWVNMTPIASNTEVRDIMLWDNSPLIIIRNSSSSSGTSAIRLSTDDGVTSTLFETGLGSKANIISMGLYGDYVYVGTTTNQIQRYNVKSAPVFVSPTPAISAVTSNTANFKATISAQSKVYYVVVPKDAAVPTLSQIIVGKDAADAIPVAAGNAVSVASVEMELPVSGLNPNTEYTLYAVAVSETAVTSEVVTLNFATTLGTDLESLQSRVKIYPNPTSGIVNVSTNSSNTTQIKVYNTQGSEVLSVYGKSNIKLDLSNLSQGVYFIKVDNTFFKTIKD